MGEYHLKFAQKYMRMGLVPILLVKGAKNPPGTTWMTTKYENERELHDTFMTQDCNVGILLGQPSNNFVDVDLDCIEAVKLAPQFLPATKLQWGRMSKPVSHWGYRITDTTMRRYSYDNLPTPNDEDKVLVEIRGDGHQTAVPPSVHPSGEEVKFYSFGDPTEITLPELQAATGLLATAALLAKNWDNFGPRHFLTMHLAGALSRAGWNEAQVDYFITAVATTAMDEEIEDRRRVVRDTFLLVADDNPSSGWPTLRETVGELVINKMRSWLNLRDSTNFAMNDMGNAQRFLNMHGEDVRFCAGIDQWMVWDGKRWMIDQADTYIGNKAQSVQRAIMQEASKEPDQNRAKNLAKWALSSGFSNRMTAIPQVAKDIPTCWVEADELDHDPMKLNVHNGTLNLQTLGLENPHNRQEYMTHMAGTLYNPKAQCPRFEYFIEEIMDNNPSLITFMKKLAGYALTARTDEQVFPIFFGQSGSNGKSTFLEIIGAAMGDYCQTADASTFTQQHTDRIRTDLARMKGSRLVTASEISQNRKLDTAMVKGITGGDKITARFLFKNDFEYVPTYKVWMATNYKPIIQGDDQGMWRRLRLVPFEVRIPDEKQDKNLKTKIISSELAGVLRWMVEGCLLWQREGLGAPMEVMAATQHYREDSDVIKAFVSEACTTDTENDKCSPKTLYQSYMNWCKSIGERYSSMNQFRDKIEALGYITSKNSAGLMFIGIAPIISVASMDDSAEFVDPSHKPNPFGL